MQHFKLFIMKKFKQSSKNGIIGFHRATTQLNNCALTANFGLPTYCYHTPFPNF